MRFKIFLFTFALPILFAIYFFVFRWPNGEAIGRFIGAVLMAILILRVFLADRKYISNFSITEAKLEIQYLSQMLKTNSVGIPKEEIIDIKLIKTKFWLADYAGILQVKFQDDMQEYHVFKKSQLQEIETLLGSQGWGRPLAGTF